MSDLERRGSFEAHVVPEIGVLLRAATSICSQPADAEDLVQETLLRAWRSIDSFDGRHPRAWLLTILRNAEVNRHRRRRPVLLDDPDDPVASGGELPSAEDAFLHDHFDAEVWAAVETLSPDMRRVIWAIDVEGFTYETAAARLGVPVGTVMSRLHRARKRVRDSLSKSGTSAGSGS